MKVYKGFVFFERNYGEYIEVGSVAVATVLLERIGAITQDMLDAMRACDEAPRMEFREYWAALGKDDEPVRVLPSAGFDEPDADDFSDCAH